MICWVNCYSTRGENEKLSFYNTFLKEGKEYLNEIINCALYKSSCGNRKRWKKIGTKLNSELTALADEQPNVGVKLILSMITTFSQWNKAWK